MGVGPDLPAEQLAVDARSMLELTVVRLGAQDLEVGLSIRAVVEGDPAIFGQGSKLGNDVGRVFGQLLQLDAGPLVAESQVWMTAQRFHVAPDARDVLVDGGLAPRRRALGTRSALSDDEVHRMLGDGVLPVSHVVFPLRPDESMHVRPDESMPAEGNDTGERLGLVSSVSWERLSGARR